VIEAAGFDHPDLTGPYDLIFANILKGPLIALAPDLTARLNPGGYAILSGILNDQADDVVNVYFEVGNSVIHRDEIGEWTTLTLQKSHN
jgi:ribosomal protein L11 methyltransferase